MRPLSAASRDKLIVPPEVPADFWQTEQFRDAFAAQHIGRVFRAYRTHPHHYAVYGPDGISQTLLGQWLGLRQPQVSKINTGSPIPHLDRLQHWARVLRIPAELLWFRPSEDIGRTGSYAHQSLKLLDRSSARDMVMTVIDLVEAYVQCNEIDEAARLFGDAGDIAAGHSSVRLVGRLEQARAGMQPWQHTVAVRTLNECSVNRSRNRRRRGKVGGCTGAAVSPRSVAWLRSNR